MAQAIDFKKVTSKSYKVWRILQAPGAWGQIYRDREQTYRNYRSALIFPEQVMGIGGSSVYKVTAHCVQRSLTTNITNIHVTALNALMSKEDEDRYICPGMLCNMEEIQRFEHLNREAGQTHRLYLGSSSQDNPFDRHAWFTNLKDAIKYQNRLQESLFHKLG
jgi:hypothetical protein